MARFAFILLIVAVPAVYCGRTSKHCSDQNQFWNECGSYCERRCIEPEEPVSCAAVCVPKCSCKPGYIIGPDGNCITKEECSREKQCSDQNQFWNECGSYCEPRCIEPEEPVSCAAVCVPQCSCKPGYIIGPDGNCITKKECSRRKQCLGQNQFWNECGSNCEPRCIEPEEPRFCAAVCVPKCSCKPGYVIGPDEDCVEEDDCDTCAVE